MKTIFFIALAITGAIIFNSCTENILAPGNSTSIRFKIDKSKKASSNIIIDHQNNSPVISPNQLLKTGSFDEIKIMCLDMTRYDNLEQFFHVWFEGGERDLIEYELWDSTKDAWDNWVFLLKKYPGDAFDYVADYTLSIKDSVAKGTIYLNPGLNYFIYAGRKNGQSGYLFETPAHIVKDSVNEIPLYIFNYEPFPPKSPIPSNGSVNVSLNVTLRWEGTDPEFDKLIYDVYFGTAAFPPLAADGLTNSSFNPGALQPNTTYYWQVVARDDHENETFGTIWTFTTGQ